MKIYAGDLAEVGIWSTHRARSQSDFYSATLGGAVFILPPDYRRVLPGRVLAVLSDAEDGAPEDARSILRQEPFFKAFDAIVVPGLGLVYVLDADALFNVKRI